MNQKKTTALLLGLTMSLTGTAFAAPTDQAQDIDSRIAALEQQQSNLEKEIKELRHQNSQLKNQTRSQKKQLSGLSKSVKSELDRVQISGFGRVSWDNDNIKGYIDRNDNSRFYLDLKAKLKVNDRWNFNFENETNPHYKKYVTSAGDVQYHKKVNFGGSRDKETGSIQRVWAEGSVGKVNFDIGRRWRGLGFQNILLGNETDGIMIDTPIPKSKLSAQAFYLTPTDQGYHFSVSGVGVKGQIGHGLQIQAAFARTNKGKGDSIGTNYYSAPTYKLSSSEVRFDGVTGSMSAGGTIHSDPLAVTGTVDQNGKVTGTAKLDGQYVKFSDGSNLDVWWAALNGKLTDKDGNPITVTKVDNYEDYYNTAGSHGFVLSAMWNPLKNITVIGDYVRTNRRSHTVREYPSDGPYDFKYGDNTCKAVRINYRWSNINDPGSFQIYGRWFDYAKSENDLVGIFGDKEWGALQPGSRGWIAGFKYVPVKNIEWETFFEFANSYDKTYGNKINNYDRKFIRTMVDYHF